VIKMSVKKLEFEWPQYDCTVEIDECNETVRFIIWQHGSVSAFQLDRHQAHLLKIWLEEHLNEPVRKPCGCYGPAHILGCDRKPK